MASPVACGPSPPPAGNAARSIRLSGWMAIPPSSWSKRRFGSKGDPRWGAIHRNRTYLFAGQEEQRRFLENDNADRYAPVNSGDDVVLVEQGRAVPGMRQHGVDYGGHIYLFADEMSLAKLTRIPLLCRSSHRGHAGGKLEIRRKDQRIGTCLPLAAPHPPLSLASSTSLPPSEPGDWPGRGPFQVRIQPQGPAKALQGGKQVAQLQIGPTHPHRRDEMVGVDLQGLLAIVDRFGEPAQPVLGQRAAGSRPRRDPGSGRSTGSPGGRPRQTGRPRSGAQACSTASGPHRCRSDARCSGCCSPPGCGPPGLRPPARSPAWH